MLPAAHTPCQGNAPGFDIHDFLIPGIEFRLLLGAGIPADLRALCAQTSAMRYIASTTMLIDKVYETFMSLMKTSTPTDTLLKRVR